MRYLVSVTIRESCDGEPDFFKRLEISGETERVILEKLEWNMTHALRRIRDARMGVEPLVMCEVTL